MLVDICLFVAIILCAWNCFIFFKLEFALGKEDQTTAQQLRHRSVTTLLVTIALALVVLIGTSGQLTVEIGKVLATQCMPQK